MVWDSAAKSVTSDATYATVTNTTGEVLLCLWIWDSPAISDTNDTIYDCLIMIVKDPYNKLIHQNTYGSPR
jgi:hypothetical protein